uniref:Uncharacterized protein n=1 Tax=Alexandrium catenella TaxID=2925 RepID=A0A7S1PZK1_ALECA|mmetsp:Transcript_12833/g.35223  ORF Transcript_12833/g.35223 Transcript_12833/m.35223 type:complete len:342 (+) Transcript_12833:92-1117(+)
MSPCIAAAPRRRCRAGPALAAALAALAARPAAGIQPKAEGHFLTNSELRSITAISCLEARQRNPGVKCRNESLMTRPVAGTSFSGQLNAGNYPNFREPVCNSGNEFFCDPSSIFSMEERKNLTAELKRLRRDNLVTCGHLLDDPVDPRHYQPFYLGVALAARWPSGESDPDSLQQLGRIIDADWNMDRLFVGQPIPYLKCPNTAILIFMPEIRRAFVSASSCEFICQDKGGPEVATAALVALDREGPAAAVRAAIREAYRIVSRGSANAWTPPSVSIAKHKDGYDTQARSAPQERAAPVVIQRVLYGFALAALVLSLAVAAVFLLVSPGWLWAKPRSRRRK